ncbi:MAG: uroporphyrinogen decarboxylase/cobalamine-independent methonine synthase family protein [Armatimonadota bacterium]
MLAAKSDWEMSQTRLEAFWANEVVDRVIIQVTAPLPGQASPPDATGLTQEQIATDPAFQMAQLDYTLASTYYAGDAFPTYRPALGPSFFAGILGAPVEFRPGTVWYHPCITDLAAAPLPRFNPADALWQKFLRLTQAAADHAPGRFILGQSDMVPPTDILSALMGPGELCMAMLEEPELVQTWLAALTESFLDAYHAQEALLPEGNGYTSWLTCWSAYRSYCLQNDFSCMISRQTYRQFCVPELQAICDDFQRSIYHLDGSGAIQHLDALLELPRLHAIQWTPGDGQPPMSQWIPLLQRIQQAGKGLFLYCAPHEVEIILQDIAPEGVIFCTWASTPEEADDLVRGAERWTHRRLPMID